VVFGQINLQSTIELTERTSSWPIDGIKTPGFGRKGLVHKVLDYMETPYKTHAFDNELEFNTQCSSQWDSLCHFLHQPSAMAYNGAKPTVADLTPGFGTAEEAKTVPTLDHWHKRGGLVGRGVLIDYKAYAEAKGIKYSCFDAHKITIADMEACAKHQSTEFKFGDILIVRSGFTDDLGQMTAEQQEQAMGTHQCIGVEGSEDVAKWVWNHHFACVAGDMIAFEVIPPTLPSGEVGEISQLGKSLIDP